VTVTHVTASNRNEGVRIDGGNLLNINNSTFSNNTTGVTSNNVGTSSLINNNTIQANTIGVSQSGVVQVNGTSNYWGSAFAPTLNGSNGYTGNVNVGLNLPIAPAGAPAVPAYPPGNLVSFATTANPLEVTTNNDLVSADDSTSLREAIMAANVSGGNITFHAGLNAQTIRLISPLPPITKQVAINGGGLITIDGHFNSGDVFFVNGATASNSSILGLKIKGYASHGFGIRVNGASGVTLQNLDLSDPAGNFVPTGTGIQVENTSTDVMINNVNVSRTTNGIVVSSSDTPKILNVNASFTLTGVQVTQSASPTITNVNASSTTSGIRVIASANATVRDNTLNNSVLSLYLNGSTGLAVGAIRGNTFSGSSQAVRIDDGQSGLIIGNASLSGTAHVVIEDGTSGMSTVTSRAIYLKGGSANATIDSLQLGFTAGRSGEGIRVDEGGQFLTIKNSNVSGRSNGVTVTAGMNLTLTGNNLSNNGQSVIISGVTRQSIAPAAAAVTASDNIFTNSANAIAISGLTAANAGLTIGTTDDKNIVIKDASSGLQSVTGTAILLSNVDNVTIDGIDLSYSGLNGLHRSGTGIFGSATSGSTSWTITNVNASNRTTGISVNGGNDLTLTGNTLVNNGQAISIADVTKLAPASKAVFALGNIFTKSLNGLAISNLTGANAGLTIGTTGIENIVINNATSGLQSVTGTAINLSNVDNVTIVNVDVGFADGSRSGSAIIGSASSNSSFWTIRNVNASNRVSGISISGGKNVTLIDNNLSNDGQSINVSNVTMLAPAVSAVIASGNTFTNSTNAIAISTLNNSDLTIGTTVDENIVINNATDGLQSVAGTAISLNIVGNVTITGVDLGYTGGVRSGAGVKINAGPDSRSTIRNVKASNRFTGIQVTGGKDLTANNNILTNDGIALYVDSVTKSSLAASVIASGNTFANSGTALQLWNLSSGLTIGTANDSHIKIDNVNSGLQSNTGRVIYLSNISDVNIDGLDVGYNGSVRSGTGIYVDGMNNNNMIINLVTATNRSTGLRLGDAGKDLTVTNNNLSNNGLALYINNFSDGPDAGKTDNTVPVLATGNTFTGSTSGIELYNMANQVVATDGTGIIVANTDGLKDSSATALRLSNMNGLTVSSLDLSYSGAGRSGTGIYADGTNHNLTITGVSATRRNRGFRIGDAGQDLILTNNDLSNTNYGLFIGGYFDGDDANTVPVVASGNKFFGVITEALVLHNMSGLYIGTTGTGFIINNATDGLNSTPGVALRISNIPYSTIDGIDLSYSGVKRSGHGIRAIEDSSDSDRLRGFIGNNVTIQNVIATNRDYGIYLVGGGDDLKLLNNNLSNNGTSLGLQSFQDGDDADNAPFSGTGNKFTGSTNGIALYRMSNNSLVFGNSIAPGVNFVIDGNSGLTSVAGDAFYLFNVNNVTIDGVDLSYRGFRRSGTGIRANDSFVNNLTLKNVTISNRVTGLTYNPNTNNPGYLLKIQDSNFLNNATAIIAAQSNAGGYIRNSRIEGNDTGLVYNTDSSIILDAMGNYWGPGGSGAPGVNNNNGFLSNPANKVDSSGYMATIPAVLNRDYGDAPIAFAFSTSLAGFAARHIATGPMLGTIRDTEPDATGSTFANADSITATNDEDGVTVGILTPGANATATVFVTSSGAAKLDAWIDFNRDGDWDDDGEKIANSVSVVNGSNTITFAVPGSANVSLNYARFRLSTAGGLDNFGEAVDGEVEDYVVGNIYVDDNWTNSTNFPVGTVVTDADPIMAGDQWGILGLNALATVSGGLAAAAAGTQNQVIVNSGNYSTDNANITKAGLVLIFQEGASTLGSLDDTISTAIVNLAGITLTTGGTNLATRFDSSIVGNGNLIKDGSGKMTLAGDNTFTGYTTIYDGTLALASSSNNNIASSPIITVGSGKTLEVAGVSGTELQLASGQTGGAIQALSSSTIDPAGSSTGILNTQSVVFASGSTFSVQVNGTSLAGTDYDQLNVTGAVNLGNATLNAAGIVTSEGAPIVLINNDGNDTVIGTFNGLAEKANVTINGKRFVITYQGGSNNNDVVLLSPTPINTVPSNQTVDEDVSLDFVAGVNGISVLDYDDNMSTTKLTVTHGKLTIGSLVGGASISSGANNSSTLTLSGTQTQINAALATLSYHGNQDYNGPDSLVVVSTDAQNNVDTNTISISLTPVNDAPVAVNDGTALKPFGVVPKGGSLSAGPGVLNNDSDVDLGDLLTAVLFTNVLHGSLTLNADGSFNYRPTSNYSGPDSFTYRAKDIAGVYSNVATVFLNVNDAPTDILLSNNIVLENSSTVVALEIGNLSSVDANEDDSAGFTLLAGLDEALFLISGSTLKLKAGVSVDFETRPSYRVNIRVTDGSGATFDKELTIVVRDLAEIASIQNNDGQVQRTMLTKLVVTFDTAVTIDDPRAFVVRNRNTNTLAAIRVATATNSSGKTVATITFASGANVTTRAAANSLVDGNYELQIYGSWITSIATNLKVDAAKNGNSLGSNDVFGDQALDRFFRLFGDLDGDRDVDALDNAQFKPTLNSTLVANPTIYKAEFDFDGDGDIDALDNLRFRQNLNKTMPAI
jgi:fibronectin-binding autotransporter adhesin